MATIQAVVVKSFTYRGTIEEYSNVYHLNGTQPADSSAWATLLGVIKDAEKTLAPSYVTWTDGYGYNEGSWETKPSEADAHVTWSTSNTGTFSIGSLVQAPGDAAFWGRWSTGDLNSKGKPIYLRKYFHPAYMSTSAPDANPSAMISALNTYGGKFVDGTSLGGGLKICRPGYHPNESDRGHVGVTFTAGPWITTRTLKRRGKRPGS